MEANERDAQEGQSRADTKGDGAGHEWGKETDGTGDGDRQNRGWGRIGRRGAAQAGRDRTEPGAAETQGDGGEGRRCLRETEGWRKSEREMERDRGRERGGETGDGGRGGGVRDTHMEGRPGKEMNRKQSQRQGETERNGGERQWLRDGERNGQK